MTTLTTTQAETELDREIRLSVTRAREIMLTEGIPAAVHFLGATEEYLRRWFLTPVESVGNGRLAADAFPPGDWDPNECNAPADCDAHGWHFHPDRPTVLFWTGVV